MAMSATQDTEITLGTGKMVAIFFGLVILCALFFGMGFLLGKNSSRQGADIQSAEVPAGGTAASASAKRPSAADTNAGRQSATDMTFYKSVQQKSPDSSLPATADNTNTQSTSTGSTVGSAGSGYFVQVAAVSKQEDADNLVEALKKKQYPAVAAQLSVDKLYHVQVGPFAGIKEAETMRSQLLADGYNPILKK